MGLAASQARFLAITARKMNCEFQSMQIAQEKLSVTRDMQKAAQNYQTALDATKLVWDCDNDVYDLSYGLMMTPSMLNDFNPYLITDTRGRIVLTDNMFRAAAAAGVIDKDTGEPLVTPFMGGDDMSNPVNQKDGSRNAFLYQLGLRNQISGSVVDQIIGLGPRGYTSSGIGGPLFDKSRANAVTTPIFIDYLKNTTYADLNVDVPEIISLSSGSTHAGFDILWDDSGADHFAGSVRYAAGEAISENMNIKKISYAEGTILDRDVVVKVPRNLSESDLSGTYYKIGNAKEPYDLNNGINCSAQTSFTEGQYILIQRGQKAPFAFDIYVPTNEAPHRSTDKLFALNLSDIFRDKDGNSLLTTESSKLKNGGHKGKFYVTQNGQSVSNPDALANVTLGDILTGKYEICYHPADGNYNTAKSVFTDIINQMARKLGQGSGEFFGLYTDMESGLALDQALAMTRMLFNNWTRIDKYHAGSLNIDAAKGNQVLRGKDEDIYSFSLTNMLKSFLTYYAIALDGGDCGYQVIKDSASFSNYVTDDYGYYFVLHRENEMSTQKMLNADFYNMLYNQIAMNGACTDEMKRANITDNRYLQQAIKNGQLFISALSSDGYFYQRPYSMLDEHVAEVTDEDAVARAEVEYNVTKSKLNAKEETLELKMKNLDMEISSLTTEFDTVKNLISKNVEKVFTMFN